MEHSRSEKPILDPARTHFPAADFVAAGVRADLHFQTSCFPAVVGFAVVAVGLKLRLSRRRDQFLAEAAAADFEIDHRPAVAAAVK